MPRKLPVWKTVGACYVAVVGNLGQLARIGWLWLVIMLPVYAALHWLAWAWQQEDAASVFAVSILPVIVELPFLASIAVAWHRLVLRHEGVTSPAYLRLDGIVWSYALYSFLLVLLAWSPLLPLGWVANPALLDVDFDSLWSYLAVLAPPLLLLVLALAVALLVLPRLSLVLPAVALGERLSLRDAWRTTRGNTLRLALATCVCMLPAWVPALPYLWWDWSAATVSRAAYVGGELIVSLSIAVLTIFAVTLLSLMYRFFAASSQGAEGASPLA